MYKWLHLHIAWWPIGTTEDGTNYLVVTILSEWVFGAWLFGIHFIVALAEHKSIT